VTDWSVSTMPSRVTPPLGIRGPAYGCEQYCPALRLALWHRERESERERAREIERERARERERERARTRERARESEREREVIVTVIGNESPVYGNPTLVTLVVKLVE
jgi:hypothetical protein